MRDVLDDLLRVWRSGQPVGLAVVTAAWASAPRQPGAAMFVDADGAAVGSVSGGCVEGDVYLRCREVLACGEPQTVRYGVPDDEALAVGLPCGGSIELFACRIDQVSFPHLPRLAELVAAGTPVALVTCVDGPAEWLGRHRILSTAIPAGVAQDPFDAAVAGDGLAMLAADRTGLLRYGPVGERPGPNGRYLDAGLSVLVTTFAPAARMIVFGATDHAAATARIGTFLGYRVTVCDAREVFATAARFPDAADVVVDWPHRYLAAEAAAGRIDTRTVVCVLTHDPKFDVPVLQLALGLTLAYVGAMGSRRTHDDRLNRLRDAGVDDAALARLASPIGLDLGARTPEETAVSIAAEITASRYGGSGARLSDSTNPIHHTGPIHLAGLIQRTVR